MLQIKDLTVIYGKGRLANKAVDNLNLSIERGRIFGFLGPNGAGKTTTIKTLLGLILPVRGYVRIDGKDPLSRHARVLVGYMPEIANYYWYLTPKELLSFYGQLYDIDKKVLSGRIVELLELVGLKGQENALMKTFSKGMLQKVNFAQALINDPELLILDEPTAGLDPISRMQMRGFLCGLRDKKKTIFFSSHELSEVEIISDSVGILKKGSLLKVASPKDIIDEKGEHITLEKHFFELVKNE